VYMPDTFFVGDHMQMFPLPSPDNSLLVAMSEGLSTPQNVQMFSSALTPHQQPVGASLQQQLVYQQPTMSQQSFSFAGSGFSFNAAYQPQNFSGSVVNDYQETSRQASAERQGFVQSVPGVSRIVDPLMRQASHLRPPLPAFPAPLSIAAQQMAAPTSISLSTYQMLPSSVPIVQAPLLPSLQLPPSHAPLPGPVGVTTPQQPLLVRSTYGLPDKTVLFCNFNQLYKIDPQMFETWVRILKRVPNSAIWLLRFPPAGEEYLRKEADRLGLPQHQLVFTAVAGKIEHVRRGALADLCLDTHICNGHTTGMDILWAGTPMITYPGETFASRVASSLLSALGCPDLIATSLQHYEDMAVEYASNPAKLSALQQRVRSLRAEAPLFNTRLLVSNLERAYEAMVMRRSLGLSPDHIDLNVINGSHTSDSDKEMIDHTNPFL
jgi:hypothetical protein